MMLIRWICGFFLLCGSMHAFYSELVPLPGNRVVLRDLFTALETAKDIAQVRG